VARRLVIDDVRPAAPHVPYSAKAVEGERLPVSAVIFKDGHDILAAQVLLVAKAEKNATPLLVAPLVLDTIDIWRGHLDVPQGLGRHHLIVEAWTDRYATWAHKLRAKMAVGDDVELEIAEARALFEARRSSHPALRSAIDALGRTGASIEARVTPALSAEVARELAGPSGAVDLTRSDPVALWVDRPLAAVGAWYELFPRSFGGFRGVAARAPEIAAQGFDVLYLPPIHPIGRLERKGRNNTLGAGPHDPGSPWAIGSADGGHCSIDPHLGTFEDFAFLVEQANAVGLEVALDYALQCAPDHPWVTEHPEWFHHRPDGSIAYAENPPKKYQDIYPINFWPASEKDRVALWKACRAIFEFWIARGVHIFRVDNPHTKPMAFWEWVIGKVQAEHPEVFFLAEAFTRPAVMAKLAEVGFSQSYTYFTWRTEQHGPEGLWAYMEELSQGPKADFMRPNFWPSTPDILSGPLRNGPPAAFAERFILAATLSPSYGIYSGYELYENSPASPANEEYLNSEKYELRDRDYTGAGSLSQLITQINGIRRRHRAFANLRGVHLHPSDNPDVIAYTRVSDDRRDVMLIVVSLEPVALSETVLHLDRRAFIGTGLDVDALVGFDELSGERYRLGASPYIRLEPPNRVAHVLDLGTSGV
jgi:starch synthase (maltosyl-transferring)